MAQRLKVLISAYACEPGKGSEPEVGWQWSLQMARFHDVTVLTRANNGPAIEGALAHLRGHQPLPRFVYHDRHKLLLGVKRRLGSVQLYYLLWQRSARRLIRDLHQVQPFDLMHHLTFASFRYATAVWGHGVPVVWGPIGGIESIPFQLLPWKHPGSLIRELTRNISNVAQSTPYFVVPRRAAASSVILATTTEMQKKLHALGFQSDLMPTIGLDTRSLPYRERQTRKGPLKLIFVGNVIALKGIDLALDALQVAQGDVTLTIIGSGNYLASARNQAARLGLQNRVIFRGRLPREEVLSAYGDFDALIFPSLHDTGGYAVIEAMFNELPVICLDCGGPAVAVQNGCGIKVTLGPRERVVRDLAEAVHFYGSDRQALAAHGRAAREIVLSRYDWLGKGLEMNEVYHKAIARFREHRNGRI